MNCGTVHSQVCFHRRLFADRVRPHWCITGLVGPLECTNQSWCGVKLLTMSVSTHPVGCVHICHLLIGQHHSMHSNGSFCLPPASRSSKWAEMTKLVAVFCPTCVYWPIRVWDVPYAYEPILCPIRVWASHMSMHALSFVAILHALQASILVY